MKNLCCIYFLLAISIILCGASVYKYMTYTELIIKDDLVSDNKNIQFSLDSELPAISVEFPRPVNMIYAENAETEYAIEYYPVLPWGLDINRAGSHLLTIIPGIGPVSAERIVQERNIRGQFTGMDDFFRRTHLKQKNFFGTGNWIYAGEN
ncbi:helix-hairpin-helix domain-containing protein [bacterium]|nr:helix-hairpin-helix domain-containing protein [bacterium]